MLRKSKVTRGEKALLRAIRAAGPAGIRSRQLNSVTLDSIRVNSVKVILNRMVAKGLITWIAKEKQVGAGRPAHIYVETEKGKQVDL